MAIVDLYMVYSFIRRIATPFNEWKAFGEGIIDADGNILKKRSELRTVREREAFGMFDNLVLKLKVLLNKIPGGSTRIGTYAAALWLIKESAELKEHLVDLNDDELTETLQRYVADVDKYLDINRKYEIMSEDAPVNNVGGGAIAGAGVGPDGEPGVSKKTQNKIRKFKGHVIKRKELENLKETAGKVAYADVFYLDPSNGWTIVSYDSNEDQVGDAKFEYRKGDAIREAQRIGVKVRVFTTQGKLQSTSR